MAKIMTIEELAKQPEIDISEYGLKAEGLAILQQAMEEYRSDPENRDTQCFQEKLDEAQAELHFADTEKDKAALTEKVERWKRSIADCTTPKINFEVDPAFAVPKSVEIGDSPELRKAYDWLVSKPTRFMLDISEDRQVENEGGLRIIMARSSDGKEMPGKFESHSSLYDPENPEKSFNEWLIAARKVRESGAGGVIGQVLVAEAIKPTSLSGYNRSRLECEVESGEMEDTVKFGLTSYGFVANTASPLQKGAKTLSAVVGLPSKIVRGDDDFSLLIDHMNGDYSAIHTKKCYRDNIHTVSSMDFPQETMDLIDSKDPGRVKTIIYPWGVFGFCDVYMQGAFAFPAGSMNPISIIGIIDRLKEKTGRHVEIEGAFINGEHFPHIFQLRNYDLPENRVTELRKVGPECIIAGDLGSYVSDRFSGDLIVLEDKAVDETELRGALKGDYILLQDHRTSTLYLHNWGVNIGNFQDRKGLVIPTFLFNEKENPGAHSVGYMVGLLVELQKKGPVISLYTEHLFEEAKNIEGKIEQHKGFKIIRDVTVESDGEKAQIYFNR